MVEVAENITIIDDPGPVASGDGSRFTCETCGEPLSYSGRGRYPRFCDEHKPGKGSSNSGGTRKGRGEGNIEASMDQLYTMLGQGLVLIGSATGDKALVGDGELIDDRSEVLAHEWAVLARNDPKVRKALASLSTGSAWGGVVITHAMLAVAMMRNHQINGKPREPKQPKAPRVAPQGRQDRPGQSQPNRAGQDFTGPTNGDLPVHVPDQLYES